jgi:hypothetical protein
MSSPKEQALNAIKAGDIVFGVTAGGTGKLLLVYRTSASDIFARHVPSMARAQFDRDGKSRWCEGGGSCTIVSTATLPAEQYEVVIGLDRKMRTAKKNEDYRLSKAEIQLLLKGNDFFKARPLPE